MASPYPDWVPKDVVEYFERERNRVTTKYHGLEADFEILGFAIQSANMQKAWEAISRRRDKADPALFAQSIVDVSCRSRNMDKFPSLERIKDFHNLAERSNKLADEIADKAKDIIAQDWYDYLDNPQKCYPLKSFLKNPPALTLRDLADYFDATAQQFEEERTELTAKVGKPGALDTRRIYVIRSMSECTSHLYGQPLHDVVARTCCEILDEEVDSELVRKLVKIGKSLPPPYRFGDTGNI